MSLNNGQKKKTDSLNKSIDLDLQVNILALEKVNIIFYLLDGRHKCVV